MLSQENLVVLHCIRLSFAILCMDFMSSGPSRPLLRDVSQSLPSQCYAVLYYAMLSQ